MFFGSDAVSMKTLERLHADQTSGGSDKVINHLEVITSPTQLAPVVAYAAKNRIPLHQPDQIKDWKLPESHPFDLAVVVSYGRMIPSHLLKSFPLGGINMHPSLLPRYRGAAPLYHTLLNKDKESGVSVIELSIDKFDVGKVLHQSVHEVNETDTFTTLRDRLSTIGAGKVMEVLRDLPEKRAASKEQSSFPWQASLASKVNKEMGYIDWQTQTSEEIYTLWRALGDTFGLNTVYRHSNTRVRLITVCPPTTQISYANANTNEESYPAGTMKFDKQQDVLFVRCKDGWCGVAKLQKENGKVLTAREFAVGYRFVNVREASEDIKFVKMQV